MGPASPDLSDHGNRPQPNDAKDELLAGMAGRDSKAPEDRLFWLYNELLCYLVALAVVSWGFFAVWAHRGAYKSVGFVAAALTFGSVIVGARMRAEWRRIKRPRHWFRTLWDSGLYLSVAFAVGVSIATFKAWRQPQTVGTFEIGGSALLGAFIVGIVFEGAAGRSSRTSEEKTAWRVGVTYLLVSALVATFGLAQGNGSYHTFALMALFGSLMSAALLIVLETRRKDSSAAPREAINREGQS